MSIIPYIFLKNQLNKKRALDYLIQGICYPTGTSVVLSAAFSAGLEAPNRPS